MESALRRGFSASLCDQYHGYYFSFFNSPYLTLIFTLFSNAFKSVLSFYLFFILCAFHIVHLDLIHLPVPFIPPSTLATSLLI